MLSRRSHFSKSFLTPKFSLHPLLLLPPPLLLILSSPSYSLFLRLFSRSLLIPSPPSYPFPLRLLSSPSLLLTLSPFLLFPSSPHASFLFLLSFLFHLPLRLLSPPPLLLTLSPFFLPPHPTPPFSSCFLLLHPCVRIVRNG